jgi:hypothetical protein
MANGNTQIQQVNWVYLPNVTLGAPSWIWAGDTPAQARTPQYHTKQPTETEDTRPVIAEILFKLATAIHANAPTIQVNIEDGTYIVSDPTFTFPGTGAPVSKAAAAAPPSTSAQGGARKRAAKKKG